jgi:23S rRNA (guanine2445-N2)-methyltransferase / 23S rRNA (guanine2069-N7)-methyltransferase
MNTVSKFFATAPKGMEGLLAAELRELGASHVAETRAGASFEGTLSIAYRACLWSRIASRVLMPLARFPAPTPEDLYAGVCSIRWGEHLSPTGTLAVDFSASQSRITHTHFGAQKVKDAIVDQLRERFGTRPSVALARPDIRVNVYLYRDEATVGLDLSGESLHRRGYRGEGGQAPLKENLAAAILLRAGWPALAEAGGPLVDPMCGSGTLPIEGALMAADIAPGLGRPYFGFLRWKGHDDATWHTLIEEAHARKHAGLQRLPPVLGCDLDPRAVRIALANLDRAGLSGRVQLERRELGECRPPPGTEPGLVVVNPPYGERLGTVKALEPLYTKLGEVLRAQFQGWRVAVLTGNPELGKRMGLRARRHYTLYNGAIECRLQL